MANGFKTTVLLAGLTAFFLIMGQYLGGQNGLIIAFIFAAVMNLGSYWFSDKIVLAMYRGKQVNASEAPELYNLVAELTQSARMPMPRIYIIPQETPNAFATGRNPEHAAVAVTEGILRILSRDELKGVLAHELSHVQNRDILIGSIAATLAGAIMMLASMARWTAFLGGMGRSDDNEGGGGGGIIGLIVMSILAPIAAMLIQMAISRSREFQADATGAALVGNGRGLAGALQKLEYASKRIPMDVSPQTAHMFIVNPLSGRSLMNLFSTHPPIEERIKRLREMG
jgi:heat shock protein HtpX